MDKNQEPYESKNNGVEVEEKFTIHKLKTVSDGGHEHEYMPDFVDSEGRQHVTCTKCWQGDYK